MNEQLIDQIYEAAFVPELWPSIFDGMSQIAEARGGYLVAATPEAGITCWTASDSMRGSIERAIDGAWLAQGERFTRLAAARRPGFLTEYDIYTDDEMAADPFYRDLLWPAGLGWGAGNMLKLPTGDALIFAVERPRERGPIESTIVQQLDAYYPHIARSVLVAARLQLERARAASDTLALLGLPALVFAPNGRVLAANNLIEPLTDYLRWHAQDRFSLKDLIANGLLQNAITTLQLDHARSTRSFILRSPDGHANMVGHVMPISGASRDVFVHCAGVFVLTPASMPKAPPVEMVRSLFDLTPSEARVARGLASGLTVEDIASQSFVSRNTVRSQVRGVLEKTGCKRQAEVVALLTGLSSFGNE